MKKLFALAFMSLAAITGTTSTASAWWPCFPLCGGCCSNSCSTTICLRQYNAFTPVCSGTLCCDGCNPFNLGCGQLGSGPAVFGLGSCAGGMCARPGYGSTIYAGDTYQLGQLPPAAILSQPPVQAPAPNGMPTAPAATMPLPPGATSAAPQMFRYAAPVQPVGYYPMYYYGYSAAPYYWNGGR